MPPSLLSVMFSDPVALYTGFGCFICAVACFWGPLRRFLWLPVFTISALCTFLCVVMCFVGGFGLLILPVFWPFPLCVVLLLLCRPKKPEDYKVGAVVTVILGILLYWVPLPGGMHFKLRFVDQKGAPVAKGRFAYHLFNGLGANQAGAVTTDDEGIVIFTLFKNEDGDVEISSRQKVIFAFSRDYWAKGIKDVLNVYSEGTTTVLHANSPDVARIIVKNVGENGVRIYVP